MQLQLKNIKKSFSNQLLFEHLNFDFSHAGFYLLCGESGCGKSTLLSIIAGYEKIDEGERLIDPNCKLAMIFQSYELIDSFTVEENITLHLTLFEQNLTEEDKKIITMLQLEPLLQRYPKELSQGQKQRVGIARALLMHPDVILCDEVTEALDTANKEIVLTLLKELSKTKAVIVVTHDLERFEAYYDEKYVIKDHQFQCVKRKNSSNLIPFKEKQQELHTHRLKQIVQKMIHRSTRNYAVLLMLLIIVQGCLLFAHCYLFSDVKETAAVNSYVHYVTRYPQTAIEEYNFPNLTPCIAFQPLQLKEKKLPVHVLPFPKTSGIIVPEESVPKNNNVIINQNMAIAYADYLGVSMEEIIGETIAFDYVYHEEKTTMAFQIQAIIEEPSVKEEYQVYYDPMYMELLLSQNIEEEVTMYEDLMEKGTLYAVEYEEKNYQEAFMNLKDDTRISLYNSILTAKEEARNEKQLFSIIFIGIQCFLLLITVLFTLFFTKKETQRYAASMSILSACQANLSLIKRYFIQYKISSGLLGVISACSLVMLIGKLIFSSYISLQILLGIIAYGGILFVIYSVNSLLALKKVQQNKITILLKEEKANH